MTLSADLESHSASDQPQHFIPFQTGPSLECIPDDVLYEILSYFPTLGDIRAASRHRLGTSVTLSTELVRTPTLRVLSQTSRLLRSRCLAMAWQSVKLCRVRVPVHGSSTFYEMLGDVTEAAVRVLTACPHLLPLIQTVSVNFSCTKSESAETLPAFAACLATLPNLTAIHVVCAHSLVASVIIDGFEGKQFPSVRRIALPCVAFEIIKCCPNLEEVTCTGGGGGIIIKSLIKADCRRVRVLRGLRAFHKRLSKSFPNLKHVSVPMGVDMTSLRRFPLLDTIEIEIDSRFRQNLPLRELAAPHIEKARGILKGNKSEAGKTVLLTKWYNAWNHAGFTFTFEGGYLEQEAIKV